MESTEEQTIRIDMVEMHQYFIEKINDAIRDKRAVEAVWLIYACLENRYFRIIKKFKHLCSKCSKNSKCRSNKNQLALATKIKCVQRLCLAGVPCISNSFDEELFSDTLKWVKTRNLLTHQLLSLDSYQNTYEKSFLELATSGVIILNTTYQSCTTFRKLFYDKDYTFVFPPSCMDECPCGAKPNEILKSDS